MLPVGLLVSAYASGWFPMADDRGSVAWYSPDPRAIIPLDACLVPGRLQRVLRQGTFRIEIDTAFPDVIRACAKADRGRDGPGTWISEEIVHSYCALHHAGYAHSVETWTGDRLVGCLYGVALGAAFFGESMFATEDDASKVAFVTLVGCFKKWGFHFVDAQVHTPHLERFGARPIPRPEYLQRLASALETPTRRGTWT